MNLSSAAKRDLLARTFAAAVSAVRGDRVLQEHSRVEAATWIYCGPGGNLEIPLPAPPARLIVLGAGKAAAFMAEGMESVFGDRIDSGAVIVKHAHGRLLRRIQCLEAGHPIPDAQSLAATRQVLCVLDPVAENDVVFLLLSGGASSLLCLPAEGISFADKVRANELLVISGATIYEVNVVRKHLSAVKGGRLLSRCRARSFCTLAISDVVGDDPSTIGSGPSFADPSTFADALAVIDQYRLRSAMPPSVIDYLRSGNAGGQAETPKPGDAAMNSATYRVIASNAIALQAAAAFARSAGLETLILSDRMTGATHDAARAFAQTLRRVAEDRHRQSQPVLVLAGGETTLAASGGGKGGRNQEFALVAGMNLQGTSNIALLAAGTDGTDGPTDAAGAFADGATAMRAQSVGADVLTHLADNNAYPLLASTGDLYHPGPTGTNVMDLVVAIVGG